MTTRTFKRRLKQAQLVDLLGGKCARCDTTEKLHFDHIVPSTKLFNLAVSYDKPLEVLLKEVKKCQLLCESCHGSKTAIEDLGLKKTKHGDLAMYTNKRCRCNLCKEANTIRMKSYRSIV